VHHVVAVLDSIAREAVDPLLEATVRACTEHAVLIPELRALQRRVLGLATCDDTGVELVQIFGASKEINARGLARSLAATVGACALTVSALARPPIYVSKNNSFVDQQSGQKHWESLSFTAS
jgi:hypothetical protein